MDNHDKRLAKALSFENIMLKRIRCPLKDTKSREWRQRSTRQVRLIIKKLYVTST